MLVFYFTVLNIHPLTQSKCLEIVQKVLSLFIPCDLWGKSENKANKQRQKSQKWRSQLAVIETICLPDIFLPSQYKILMTGVWNCSSTNRITELKELEGPQEIIKWTFLLKQVLYNKLQREMSRRILNISIEGGSTSSLGSPSPLL